MGNKFMIISLNLRFTDPVTIASEYGAYAYNLGLIDYKERQKIEFGLLQLQYAKD